MRIIYNFTERCREETAVALGCFDGLHRGHISVIKQVVKSDLKSVVFTFQDHPKNYFNPESVKKIYTIKRKNQILADIGVNIVYYVSFKDIVNLSAEEFVEDILVDKLNAKEVSCGFNYHFGKGGTSSAKDLLKICNKYRIKVCIMPPVIDHGTPINSTKIRSLIKSDRVDEAQELLGRHL